MRFSILLFIIIFIYFINCINCKTIIITAGELFSPQIITARVNDVVTWKISNSKHQIIQSDKPESCIKSSNPESFSSAIQEGGEYKYSIKQTSGTIYYFSAYSTNCMWGKIDIDTSIALEALTDASNSTNSTATPIPEPEVDNLPIIIGSSIGGFFALAILGLIIFVVYRRNKYQKQYENSKSGGGVNNNNNVSSISTSSFPILDNNNSQLSRTNTQHTQEHSTNEVVTNYNLKRDETIRSYEGRASSEHGGVNSIYRGPSIKDSIYQYDINSGEGSRTSSLAPPPTYNPTYTASYNPYDNEKSQQQQQPPIPPRPNIAPPQQFGVHYLPPRPSVVNRYSPQYGSSSPPFQEAQYNSTSDPYGPANPGQYYPQHQQPLRQSTLPRPPPPPPPLQPPPSQPLPPPPTQQQTGQYDPGQYDPAQYDPGQYDPAQYYGSNN